jgi:hypothetical protein
MVKKRSRLSHQRKFISKLFLSEQRKKISILDDSGDITAEAGDDDRRASHLKSLCEAAVVVLNHILLCS